jgi:hypothetical protein
LSISVLELLDRSQGARTVAQQYVVSWRVRYETIMLWPRPHSRWVIAARVTATFALMQQVFPAI